MDSFISWIGGKRALRKKILGEFPTEYERYIEVFGGAAWILFAKEKTSFEIYNDIDNNLVNLFRCTKYHPDALKTEIDSLPISREVFVDFKNQMESSGLTDIQRAARFYYLIKVSYGTDLRSFGCRPRSASDLKRSISEASDRLDRVLIENKSYQDLIEVYDRPDALFYLDPPYRGTEKYYSFKFSETDHHKLCDLLHNLKGKFLLSYNDDKLIRQMYKDFNIIETERFNSISRKGNFKELIIKNF